MLMISCAFPPTGGPGVQRAAKFAKYLPQFGWSPLVWSAAGLDQLPQDPTLRAELPPEVDVREVQWRFGRAAAVHRARSMMSGVVSPRMAQVIDWRMAKLGGETPWPDEFVVWARRSVVPLRRLIEAEGVEAIWSTFSPVSNHLLAMELAGATGLPWIADFRDLWVDDLGYHADADRRARDEELQQKILERADAVVGVSPAQTDVLADELGEARGKFHTITNGYDIEDFDGAHAVGAVERRFTLTYVGRLEARRTNEALFRGLRLAAEALGALSAHLHLRFVGFVSKDVERRLSGVGFDCAFAGYVAHRDAIEEMCAADALLLCCSDEPGGERIINGKVFEYLASRRPILFVGPADGPCAEIVRSVPQGCVVGTDSERLGSSIASLVAERIEEGAGLATEASVPEVYSRRALTGRLAEILDEVNADRSDGAQQERLEVTV